ncbi:uncharacterized protein LOC122160704 [Centrocercus urophasianus]|uniref:uncharacterized protein LOC122160704 n=1 Tax=Centrocercus urophasianus TaxID=9002 RepID=UPI001C649D61|nr:uncharacterized protein LOC122160704 [Centrocercus urophasianus]
MRLATPAAGYACSVGKSSRAGRETRAAGAGTGTRWDHRADGTPRTGRRTDASTERCQLHGRTDSPGQNSALPLALREVPPVHEADGADVLQQTTRCDRTHVAESCDADGPDSCIVPVWWRRGFSGDICYQQRLFLPTWLTPYAPLSGSVLLGAHLGCPRLVAAVALLIGPGRAEQEGVICASPHWKGSVSCSRTLGAGCPCTVPPVLAGSHRLHLADLSPTWKRPSQAMRLVPWLWKLPRTARVCRRGHILPLGPGRCWSRSQDRPPAS